MYQFDGKILKIFLSGDYLHFDNEKEQKEMLLAAELAKGIIVEGENLKSWDSSLGALLYEIAYMAQKKQIFFDMSALPPNLQHLVELALTVDRRPPQIYQKKLSFLERLGEWGLNMAAGWGKGVSFIKLTFSSVGRLFCGKAIMREKDFWFALEDCSYKALGIVTLVSFMVGLILAFVGAIQLKTFGAQIYVSSLVTVGMIRIMGAIMVGIIMAGRTGASYAAAVGTMQVNEEIDALKTMGIPVGDFLVLPRFISLVMVMPLLTVLADFSGMAGGGLVGIGMLGIPSEEYWKYSVMAFGLNNFLTGLFHGLVYGVIIALCGCYYGVNCGRNADSVGTATTKAVVSAIVWMIVVTGIITFVFEVLGI